MEIALEQEQEFIVNRLQKQLEALRQQQNPTSSSGSSTPLHKPRKSINSPSLSSFAEFPPNLAVSPGMIEVVKAEVSFVLR